MNEFKQDANGTAPQGAPQTTAAAQAPVAQGLATAAAPGRDSATHEVE